MEVSTFVKRKVIWWIIGSLGGVGIAIVLLVLLLGVAFLGMLISSSDSSSMESMAVPAHPDFDIPPLLLPIYIQAENEKVSWARLAAIHQVATNFGEKKAKRSDTVGGLGFPRELWQSYKVDADGDQRMDPDNPYDAIFSLAHYLRQTDLTEKDALLSWFLNEEDVERVWHKEQLYAAVLWIPRGWIWPVMGYHDLSSHYGYRTDPVTGTPGTFHQGIDIPAPRGTPVLSVDNGVVVQVIRSHTGYGHWIRIHHEGGYQSLYAHLADMGVRSGQMVLRGELIGWVGSTGRSTGPHLHLEIWHEGQPTDPMLYWSNDE